MNAGCLLPHLARQQPARLGETRLAHDAPADRFTFQAIHQEKGHVKHRRIDAQPARSGHHDAGLPRRREHAKFLLAAQGFLLDGAPHVPAKHDSMLACLRPTLDRHIDSPAFPAGAAGQLPRCQDAGGSPGGGREKMLQAFLKFR